MRRLANRVAEIGEHEIEVKKVYGRLHYIMTNYRLLHVLLC